MQIVELKIEDNYIDIVLTLLKSLREDMIQEINIKYSDQNKINDNLREFNSLIKKEIIA